LRRAVPLLYFVLLVLDSLVGSAPLCGSRLWGKAISEALDERGSVECTRTTIHFVRKATTTAKTISIVTLGAPKADTKNR
jgi:hypothetical protein